MIKQVISAVLYLGIVISMFSCNSVQNPQTDSEPVSHKQWTALLKKHVTDDGLVDYKGFAKDSGKLNDYLSVLSDNHPNADHWSKDQRLAYWINAYNAFTVQLVLRHYPVESIKDVVSGPNITFVNSPWDIKFIKIEGKAYDLNNIEHGIIRERFEEPRIHFAVNCASISCPKLPREAYTAAKLDQQLEAQAADFINDPSKNRISSDNIKISRIFKWFKGDFTENHESLQAYINQYTETKIDSDAEIEWMAYDWGLNDASKNVHPGKSINTK